MRPVLAVFVAGATAAACAVPRRAPTITPFPDPAARPVAHISGIRSYGTALATISTIFDHTFGFKAVSATIEIYPDDRAVETAMIALGYEPAFARDASTRLRAVAAHKRVLVNEGRLSEDSWTSRVGLLAHELVHCLQYDLGGGRRGTSEQWLREGFAEWIALKLLEELRALDPGVALRFLRDDLGASERARAPRFDDMMTFRQWVDLAGRPDLAPYAQAALSADILVRQHGMPAVLDYFSRFAAREDPVGNFRAAFGIERSTFESAVDRELGLTRRQLGGILKSQK